MVRRLKIITNYDSRPNRISPNFPEKYNPNRRFFIVELAQVVWKFRHTSRVHCYVRLKHCLAPRRRKTRNTSESQPQKRTIKQIDDADAYMHTRAHAFMHSWIHGFMHSCIRAFIHVYTHTHRHTYMHTRIHAYMDSRIHAFIPSSVSHTRSAQHKHCDALVTARTVA